MPIDPSGLLSVAASIIDLCNIDNIQVLASLSKGSTLYKNFFLIPSKLHLLK